MRRKYLFVLFAVILAASMIFVAGTEKKGGLFLYPYSYSTKSSTKSSKVYVQIKKSQKERNKENQIRKEPALKENKRKKGQDLVNISQ